MPKSENLKKSHRVFVPKNKAAFISEYEKSVDLNFNEFEDLSEAGKKQLLSDFIKPHFKLIIDENDVTETLIEILFD
jgi:hypothetical protein